MIDIIIKFVQGMIIGVGGVLPGISGGVLCTVFGVYEPLVEVIAHPKKNFKKYAKLLIPTVIGIFAGFLGLAKLVEVLFSSYENLAVCVFIGLILGMLPSLKKSAEQTERKKLSLPLMGIAFVLFSAILFFIRFAGGMTVKADTFGFILCGFLFGLGIVVPGLCGPSFMLFLGLYEPLMELISGAVESLVSFITGKAGFSEALTAMRIPYCFAFGLVALGTIILLSKPVDYCIGKYPSELRYVILGIVAATVLPLVPKLNGAKEIILAVVCVIVGFAVAFFTDRLSNRYMEKQNEKNTAA
ncbi:MAG: DUF368 domain-containing protein [Firmicutes bacterium]|nr:DUF368 domain-containing protein [Candidatus Colimorpha enterica]